MSWHYQGFPLRNQEDTWDQPGKAQVLTELAGGQIFYAAKIN